MELITIDESGRVFIPQDIRQQMGLNPGSQLTLEVNQGKLIIKPFPSQEAKIINDNGLLVIDSNYVDNFETIIDDLRLERINTISPW